jgi:hypothetical protein
VLRVVKTKAWPVAKRKLLGGLKSAEQKPEQTRSDTQDDIESDPQRTVDVVVMAGEATERAGVTNHQPRG